jgi:CRP/FNR family transcriptional regulator, cyclic AMP receptor protein
MTTQSADDLKTFLESIPVFGGLEERTLDRIVAMLDEQKYEPKTAVCREGETGNAMYIIGSGEVVLCRTGETGRQIRVVRMGRGDFFGETTLIEMQPRPATAIVQEPATIYSLTNKDLYRLYREDIHGYVMVIQNICRELSRRLRRADSRITKMAEDAEDEHTQIGRVSTSPKKK